MSQTAAPDCREVRYGSKPVFINFNVQLPILISSTEDEERDVNKDEAADEAENDDGGSVASSNYWELTGQAGRLGGSACRKIGSFWFICSVILHF